MSPPPEDSGDDRAAEVIEVASELMEADEKAALHVNMREVGAELGIPARYIDQAEAELGRRRERAKVRRIVAVVAAVGALIAATPVALHFVEKARPAPAAPKKSLDGVTVVFDLRRGDGTNGGADRLASDGASVRLAESELTPQSLEGVQVLALIQARRAPFSDAELDAVERFVRGGGGLIVADVGWSWTLYAHRPLPELPANVLGKRLGFSFDEQVLDTPGQPEVDAGVLIRTVHDWVPGGIVLAGPDARILMRDVKLRPVAGTLNAGRGRIVLFGHHRLLDDYPRLLAWAVGYAAGR